MFVVVIGSEGKVFYRTRVITVPGAWNETVEIDIYRLSDTIQFELFDKVSKLMILTTASDNSLYWRRVQP